MKIKLKTLVFATLLTFALSINAIATGEVNCHLIQSEFPSGEAICGVSCSDGGPIGDFYEMPCDADIFHM